MVITRPCQGLDGGSIPPTDSKCNCRIMAITSAFQADDTSSILVSCSNYLSGLTKTNLAPPACVVPEPF